MEEQFLHEMAEILDVDVSLINKETRFRDIDGYGSMVGFSILIALEENYNTRLEVDEFLTIDTIGGLLSRINK